MRQDGARTQARLIHIQARLLPLPPAVGKRGERGERGKSKRGGKYARWRGKILKATASAPQSRSGGDGLLLEEVDGEPHCHGRHRVPQAP